MNAFEPQRVVSTLRELANRTGGDEGSRRLCWTPDWKKARDYFIELLSDLPVRTETDEAGNLWAYLDGHRPDVLLVGSHLDSVPKGGWLDGALGVMAGVEFIRSQAMHGKPPVTLAVVDWADEEGARFGRSLFGSAAVVGTLDISAAALLVDKEGHRLMETVARYGVDLTQIQHCAKRIEPVKAYVEVHIEQGPVLESQGLAICTVTGTKGIERERLIFRGQAAHAGTMPMPMRRDSMLAASRFALTLAQIAKQHEGVATTGYVSCWPGVVTAVAGETRMTMDMRHTDATLLASMHQAMRKAALEAAQTEGCTVSFEPIFSIPPMPFHPKLLDAARASVLEVEGHNVELPSGALHDASEVARVVPTVMIFASSTNGLSHTKEEDTPEDHLLKAADAFNRTCLRTIALLVDGPL